MPQAANAFEDRRGATGRDSSDREGSVIPVCVQPEAQTGTLATATTSGPARVSESAGTGTTNVALHRAAHLARTNPDS
jgi:hypothetical protein